MSITRDMERLFLQTPHRVVSAFPVIKCNPSGQSRDRKRPPAPSGKPRVLCVTVQRRVGSRGFKATLHVCKGQSDAYEVRKSIRLRLIAKLEAFGPPLAAAPLLEVTVVQRAFTGGDMRLAFEASSDAARAEILGILYSFCRSHEHTSPQLLGIKRAELGVYADVLDDEDEEEDEDARKGAAGEDSEVTPIKSIDTDDTSSAGGLTPSPTSLPAMRPPAPPPRPRAGKPPPLPTVPSVDRTSLNLSVAETELDAAWSARQDAELAGLLDAVAGGAASLGDARSRLAAELSALEGANVHELLESAAAAGAIEEELGVTLGHVDDLEETLQMMDAKLRHMREDIAAIEEWNNRLETHSRSNLRLLGTLEGVTAALALDPKTEPALRAAEWDAKGDSVTAEKMEGVVAAAWDLHRHLIALGASGEGGGGRGGTLLSPAASSAQVPRGRAGSGGVSAVPLFVSPKLHDMAAVAGQRRRMESLASAFLRRATELLSREYTRAAEKLTASVASAPAAERLRPPSHSPLHARAAALAPLLEVVVAMEPSAAAPVQAAYCKAVNGLLRKELSGATKELLKLAGGGSGGSGAEPDLGLRSADSVRTIERLMSTPSRPPKTAGEDPPTSAHHRRWSSSSSARDLASGGGMALDEAFEALVSTSFPLITSEVAKCLELVCGGAEEGSPVARAATSALLASVPETVLSFVDTAKPPRMLACPGMVATCLAWQAKLRGRPGGAAACDLLRQAELRLRAGWDAYLADSVAAIRAYDGTASAMGGPSARSVHVLPFIINLEAVAARLEDAATHWAQRDARSVFASGLSPRSAANSAVAAPGGGPSPLVRPSPFESTTTPTGPAPETPSSVSIGGASSPPSSAGGAPSSASSRQSTLPAPSAAVRSMADALYHQIFEAALAAVEAHAARDAKHGPRVRLENYAFLRLSLQSLPLNAAPALQKRCSEAAAARNAALAACVDQQLEAVKLDRLVGLGAQLAELAAAGVGPSEAATRLQWATADARAAVSAAAAGLDKRLVAARQKLHKHLASSSPYLVDVMWERVAARAGQAWEELEQRLPAVFPGVGVVPTAEGLRTAFAAAKVASP